MIAVIFSSIYFTSCGNEKQTQPEVKKEVEKQPDLYVPPTTPVSAGEMRIDGASMEAGDGIVKSIPNYDPTKPVYAPCGETNEYGESSGNGWMSGWSRSLWPLYEVKYDASSNTWKMTQPVTADQKPLMFTLCQVDEVNGAVKQRFLPLEPFLGSQYLYDNHGGPNKRVAFCSKGYQPELVAGKVIPLAFTPEGKPYPNLPNKPNSAGR